MVKETDPTTQINVQEVMATQDDWRESLVESLRAANLRLVEAMRQKPVDQGLVQRRQTIAYGISQSLAALNSKKTKTV